MSKFVALYILSLTLLQVKLFHKLVCSLIFHSLKGLYADPISERRRVGLICRNETNVDESVFESLVNNDYASVDPSVPKNMVIAIMIHGG